MPNVFIIFSLSTKRVRVYLLSEQYTPLLEEFPAVFKGGRRVCFPAQTSRRHDGAVISLYSISLALGCGYVNIMVDSSWQMQRICS